MPDPLSTTASIIAIIQLSSQIIKYINGVTGATKERKRLRESLRGCEFILQQLKDDADDTEEGKLWSETIKALEGPNAPLGRIWIAFAVIKTKLEPQRGLEKAVTSLKWPYNEKEVEKMISIIEHEKTLLQLALTNDCRKLIYEIKRSSNENKMQLTELIKAVESSAVEHDKLLSKIIQQSEIASNESKKHFVDLNRKINGLNQGQDDQQRRTILDWLTLINHTPQQHDFIGRRQAGTGKWLLKSTEFQAWLETNRQTMFCPGIPGAGKTILTSIVVEELNSRFCDDENVGIAYLYCSFRRQGEQEIDNLLLNLLRQLAESQPSLPDSIKDLYSQYKTKHIRPSVDEISRSLQSVVNSYSRVFIIIDALDECQVSNGTRMKFLSEILTLQTEYRANLFTTSRSIPDITERFREAITLEVRANSDDVRSYLDSHISQLPGFVIRSPELQEEIKSKIVDSVGGIFLLAQLFLDSLIGKRSAKEVRKALATLPTGSEAYDHAYNDAMERIEGQVKNQEELAKEVLSWIVCAMRPLSILELQHALAIELNEPRLDESNLSDIGDIVSACAGLVTIDKESNIIRLVHYTAQEFFERTHNRWFPGVETNIASICITYLSFDVFKTGFCRTDAELKERFKDNQFFKYAVKNWGHHARKSPTLSQSFSQAIIDFLTSEAKVEAASQGLLDAIFLAPSRYATRFPNRMKQLQLAVYFGLEGAVKLLLEKYNVTVESKDFDGRILLSWAARNGHIHTVKLLLENGAAVDKNTDEDDESPSPLVYALKMGHIDTAKLLLENGAEVDSKDGRMLLSWAIRRGHIDIVKLLLENGAEADSIDFDGRTPLSWAARNGHIDIVKLLLENDAEIDKKDDEDGGSPLVFATRNGHIDTVKLLLENGAEADSKDSDGRTPLSWAAGNGSETIVTLLPELGKADINATDKDGRTPLWWAANGGYLKISEQLQKKGADAKVFHQLHEYELLSPTLSRVRLENGWFYIKAE